MTYRLVRDAVEVEAVEPLTLKGKSQRVPAYRIVSAARPVTATRDGSIRRSSAAMQNSPPCGRRGRAAVSRPAGRTWSPSSATPASASRGWSARSWTACRRRARASCAVVAWPTATASRSGLCARWSCAAADIARDDTPETALRQAARRASATPTLPTGSPSADRPERRATFPLHEIYWGARQVPRVLAGDGPVLAMIDDIHWAEPAFLDLIEHLLGRDPRTRRSCCSATARHDLLEKRPSGASASVRRGSCSAR